MRSMLPQSRKTTVRSAMSAGGSWKTSSSGRKRYSIGSGNSFAAMNITESLPSWVSRWCMPSSEPSASPSGPSWAVSRKRSRSRSSAATRSISVADGAGRLAHSPSSASSSSSCEIRIPDSTVGS